MERRDSLSEASSTSLSSLEDSREDSDEGDDWIPHCFVKSKSKEVRKEGSDRQLIDAPLSRDECFLGLSSSSTPKRVNFQFIGCTSMSEAFHRLDIGRAVNDVRRFNYVCKAGRGEGDTACRSSRSSSRRSCIISRPQPASPFWP